MLPLLLLPLSGAWAQVDPRLAEPMLQALQAQLALQQAMLKVQAEDAEAQKATLWEWFLAAQGAAVGRGKKGAARRPLVRMQCPLSRVRIRRGFEAAFVSRVGGMNSGDFAGLIGRRKMPTRTKGGKQTAVADVEAKLKQEYPGNKSAVYGRSTRSA